MPLKRFLETNTLLEDDPEDPPTEPEPIILEGQSTNGSINSLGLFYGILVTFILVGVLIIALCVCQRFT
jgi:hypothetical protein